MPSPPWSARRNPPPQELPVLRLRAPHIQATVSWMSGLLARTAARQVHRVPRVRFAVAPRRVHLSSCLCHARMYTVSSSLSLDSSIGEGCPPRSACDDFMYLKRFYGVSNRARNSSALAAGGVFPPPLFPLACSTLLRLSAPSASPDRPWSPL